MSFNAFSNDGNMTIKNTIPPSHEDGITRQVSIRIPVEIYDKLQKHVARYNKRPDHPSLTQADIIRWALKEKMDKLDKAARQGAAIAQ